MGNLKHGREGQCLASKPDFHQIINQNGFSAGGGGAARADGTNSLGNVLTHAAKVPI